MAEEGTRTIPEGTQTIEEGTQTIPDDSEHIERLIDDFFHAPMTPVTNHEEWLLRMAAILMEREAQISVSSGRPKRTRNNGRSG